MVNDSEIGKDGGRDWKAALDAGAAHFAAAIEAGRVHENNPESPLLEQPEIQSLMKEITPIMVQGFKEIMDGLRYAEDNQSRLNVIEAMPKREAAPAGPFYHRHNITRNVAA